MTHATLARKAGATTAANAKTASQNASGNLRIGEPDDAFEREADRAANQVMAGAPRQLNWYLSEMGTVARLQRKCACGGNSGPSGECEECRKKRLQRKALAVATPSPFGTEAPPIVHEVLRSPGQPLDAGTRSFMEPRFGHDFSAVRVHTDSRAAQSARAVQALAYTVGRDIVFAQGQFTPGVREGRHLLAHELAHTLQPAALSVQRQGDPAPVPPKSDQAALDGQGAGPDATTPGGAQAAAAPCNPTALSRADYLQQPGTTTNDFGLTKLSGALTIPAVATTSTAKGLVLQPTDAKLPPMTSVYTDAGVFAEGQTRQIDQNGECKAGMYPIQWEIKPDGAQRIRAAEMEHCADFQQAFAISLRHYADVVNDLAAKQTPFHSKREAEAGVTRLVGPAPNKWASVFNCLATKTELRDKPPGPAGWHTPKPQKRPPEMADGCKSAKYVIGPSSLPDVGTHPSAELIKGCGESPSAAAHGTSPSHSATNAPSWPPQAGRVEKPQDEPARGVSPIVTGTGNDPQVSNGTGGGEANAGGEAQEVSDGKAACVVSAKIPSTIGGIEKGHSYVGQRHTVEIDWKDSPPPTGGAPASYCSCECGEYRQYVKGHVIVDKVLQKDIKLWGGAFLEENVYHEDAANDGTRYGHREEARHADEEYTPTRPSGCHYVGRDFPRIQYGDQVDMLSHFKGQTYDKCRDIYGPIHEWEFHYVGKMSYAP